MVLKYWAQVIVIVGLLAALGLHNSLHLPGYNIMFSTLEILVIDYKQYVSIVQSQVEYYNYYNSLTYWSDDT